MGGLALKNTFTRRYQRDEFDVLWEEVSGILEKDFKEFSMPRYFASKESFGDMDIILSMEGFDKPMEDYIKETFAPNEIYHNGHAWSFDYKELQIDFITCAPENYDAHVHYFAFNDLGNFIGRLAQSIGLKYGQEGLWYNHFFKGQKIAKIIVSQDYPEIFAFLDLDYDRWVEGFDSLQEIFEYVTESRFFNGPMFQLDQLNRINRERNLKRSSYMSFLEFIDGLDDQYNENYDYDVTQNLKGNIIKVAEDVFPESNLQLEIRRVEYEHCRKLYASSIFNGKLVMNKYGLKGKHLGHAMTKFKNHMTSNGKLNYHDEILKHTQQELFDIFEYTWKARG
jgi:hypothetical protein